MEQTTPLRIKYESLSKKLVSEFLKVLDKNEITRSTFYRDLDSNSKNITTGRLQIYAGALGCDLDDLINSYVKVKPLVKKSIGKKVGIKN